VSFVGRGNKKKRKERTKRRKEGRGKSRRRGKREERGKKKEQKEQNKEKEKKYKKKEKEKEKEKEEREREREREKGGERELREPPSPTSPIPVSKRNRKNSTEHPLRNSFSLENADSIEMETSREEEEEFRPRRNSGNKRLSTIKAPDLEHIKEAGESTYINPQVYMLKANFGYPLIAPRPFSNAWVLHSNCRRRQSLPVNRKRTPSLEKGDAPTFHGLDRSMSSATSFSLI